MRLRALTHPPLWGFFRLRAGGSTGSIVSWVMGHNSLFKEAAVSHMGRKTDSTETGFVPPVLREKRQGVTLAILGEDPTSLAMTMVTLVVLGQIQ